MTLRRTIHRREARKRAKIRRAQPSSRLSYPQWVSDEILKRLLAGQINLSDVINRTCKPQ